MCLQYILIRATLSIILPHLPSTFLEQFQKIPLFYFHSHAQNNTYTIFILFDYLCFPSLIPLVLTRDRPVLPSCPSFGCSPGFCLGTLDMYILCFNQINTLCYLISLFLCCPITQFIEHYIYYLHTVVHFALVLLTLYHSLFHCNYFLSILKINFLCERKN
jgi:hypothetical protein